MRFRQWWVAAAFSALSGCASDFEYEPEAGHPARADAGGEAPPQVPDPFTMEPPFLEPGSPPPQEHGH